MTTNEKIRKVRVAAVTGGGLAWQYRQTCSKESFDLAVAQRYIREYTAAGLVLMEKAASQGAKIIVGQEYFRGSEMFTTTDENRRQLVEPPEGPTTQRMGVIAARYGAALCCSYDIALDSQMCQTGILVGPSGKVDAAQAKHPRRVPAPANWPFNTGVRIYDLGCAKVGITVCSDCTYNPELPLAMARHGMEVLLLPGCGFVGNLGRHFIVVRARDTQSVVIYADDNRGAIVDSKGQILVETDQPGQILMADVEILPKKSSPDEA